MYVFWAPILKKKYVTVRHKNQSSKIRNGNQSIFTHLTAFIENFFKKRDKVFQTDLILSFGKRIRGFLAKS